MRDLGLILGGEIRTGSPRDIRNPFDGNTVSRIGFADDDLLGRACALAWESRARSASLPLFERGRILRRTSDLIERNASELAEAIRDEAGKPISLAEIEVRRAQDTFLEAAAETGRLSGEMLPLDAAEAGAGRFGLVRRFPVGPVLAISPFNFPLNLVAHKVAPAIAAGCPLVVKPASQTPSPAILLGRLLREAGLPDGCLSVVPAAGSEASKLMEYPGFGLLTFTGSASVGWGLRGRVGRKKVLLELGGNAAAIVGPDADLDRAVESLGPGSFVYAGQVCISVQRIFVLPPRFDEFVEAFVGHVRKRIRHGDPRERGVVVGPLITASDADRVEGWVSDAVRKGARVLLEGRRSGNVLSPVILTNVDPGLPVCREEVFGPVVVVEAVKDWNEAIERTNDSEYGLQAGVFTNDLAALWECYTRLEVGGVIHNDAPTFRVDLMPYGGVKRSGLGREGPRYAIEEMTEPRLLALRP